MFRATVLALAVTCVPAGPVVAADHGLTDKTRAQLDPRAPVTVAAGSPIAVNVDFGRRFSSIDSLCFTFKFKKDFLDPGDSLGVNFFGWGMGGGAFGFANVSGPSQPVRTVCVVDYGDSYPNIVLDAFLDGQQSGSIFMETGSVTIRSVTVVVNGA
jgi:hypothetical protein